MKEKMNDGIHWIEIIMMYVVKQNEINMLNNKLKASHRHFPPSNSLPPFYMDFKESQPILIRLVIFLRAFPSNPFHLKANL